MRDTSSILLALTLVLVVLTQYVTSFNLRPGGYVFCYMSRPVYHVNSVVDYTRHSIDSQSTLNRLHMYKLKQRNTQCLDFEDTVSNHIKILNMQLISNTYSTVIVCDKLGK